LHRASTLHTVRGQEMSLWQNFLKWVSYAALGCAGVDRRGGGGRCRLAPALHWQGVV